MKTQLIAARLAVSQQVIATIHPGVAMDWRSGFWFTWESRGKRVCRRWVASSAGSDFPKWYHHAPFGGTCCRAFTQLMRWCRDDPVIPLRCWRYWCSPTVNLGAAALPLIESAGWPENVPCIGCGRAILPSERFDEYDRGNVCGPGCVPMCDALLRRKVGEA